MNDHRTRAQHVTISADQHAALMEAARAVEAINPHLRITRKTPPDKAHAIAKVSDARAALKEHTPSSPPLNELSPETQERRIMDHQLSEIWEWACARSANPAAYLRSVLNKSAINDNDDKRPLEDHLRGRAEAAEARSEQIKHEAFIQCMRLRNQFKAVEARVLELEAERDAIRGGTR